ncbi:hypothetical protein AB835_10865 [Candidatus Endobugula sertula]|uniref:Uncharacterized protein n=1 Tax=Candidatus Endobugula sertula TaxID=62101 RepID=A0A1D2QNA4_9GAMM|nr:hypothetical protein AB835_10865 [Candidatus Endobugula sertula]
MQQASGLEKAIGGFANAIAAIGVLFLIPLITRHLRESVFDYIDRYMDVVWAYYGSWAFVILAAIAVFCGAAAFLQIFVQWIFRRSLSRDLNRDGGSW